MRTKNALIHDFIGYLHSNLCDSQARHSFDRTGSRTFFYKDEVDTIFVKVTDDNLIIITDGDTVADGMEMLHLAFEPGTDRDSIRDRTRQFDYYLQVVLDKF